MNFSQKNLLRLTLFVALGVILLMSVFSFQKIKNLLEYNSKIQRVQEVQKKLEIIFSSLKDAESSQRWFVLSSDSTHLQNYNTTILLLNDNIQKLELFVSENKIQKQRTDSLSILVKERLAMLSTIPYKKEIMLLSENRKELLRFLSIGKSKMDDIRGLIDRMQVTESTVLEESRHEKIKLETVTPLFLLLIILVSIALLLISYFAMSSELKKRIAFEKELARKIEELNRSNTDLEQFAYVASHDLQEPLRKIRSFGDRLVLKHAEGLNDDGKSMIDKIQNAAGRMQRLIDDLLSFSRLINVSSKTENCNLSDLLKEVLADMDVQIHSKDAKIISKPLPVLTVVPSLVRQLFQNLISNGLKFARQDVPPKISISSHLIKGKEITGIGHSLEIDNYYKIEITDNGIGFDVKYLDRIFIIFQRLHGKLEYEGTGIGLAVCKKIMDIHHGYITAKSKLGEGSTFVLYFPIS